MMCPIRIYPIRGRHIVFSALLLLFGCIAVTAPHAEKALSTIVPGDSCDAVEPFEEEMAVQDPERLHAYALPSTWLNVVSYLQPSDPIIQPGNIPDYTQAFRRAIADISTNGELPKYHATLFVPSGTYAITDTLTLYTDGIRIVGEDPSSTVIAWYGPAYDAAADPLDGDASSKKSHGEWMIRIDGAGFGTIKRLTLDGRGKAEVAIRVAWEQSKPTWFDTIHSIPRQKGNPTGFRFMDLLIQDVARGIWGGYHDAAAGGASEDSEVHIVRCTFKRVGQAQRAQGGPTPARAAVRVDFQNTQNWNVWDSVVEDSDTGVSAWAEGSFNVWNTIFRASRFSDINLTGTKAHLIRGNTSIGSQHFVMSNSNRAQPTTIIGNTVLDTQQTAVNILGNANFTMIVDNVLRTASPPVAFYSAHGYLTSPYSTLNNASVLLTGNTYSAPSLWVDLLDPMTACHAATCPPQDVIEFGNAHATPQNVSPPRVPAAPARMQRTRYEVKATDASDDIQQVLDTWAQLSGGRPKRPVLHFPAGVKSLTKQVRIPAGLDVQIVGEGKATQIALLVPAVQEAYAFRATAPVRATFRDLLIIGAQNGSCDATACAPGPGGILIETQDDLGGQVYLRGGGLSGAAPGRAPLVEQYSRALSIENLDRVRVRWDHVGFSNAYIGVAVSGNGADASSMAHTAGARLFGGSGSGTVGSAYRTDQFGRLIVQGVEHESTMGITLANGSGAFTFVGAQYAVTEADTVHHDLVPQYGNLNTTGFVGNVTFANGLSGMPVVRKQPHAGDATFVFGYEYADTADEGFSPPYYGVFPNGSASFVDPTVPLVRVDCAPIFSVESSPASSAALLGSGVHKTNLTPIYPYFSGDPWPCANITAGVSDVNAFVVKMLADLRSAAPAPPAPACSAVNTDVQIDGVLFLSNVLPTRAVVVRNGSGDLF